MGKGLGWVVLCVDWEEWDGESLADYNVSMA